MPACRFVEKRLLQEKHGELQEQHIRLQQQLQELQTSLSLVHGGPDQGDGSGV
jgi:hypothetical protein